MEQKKIGSSMGGNKKKNTPRFLIIDKKNFDVIFFTDKVDKSSDSHCNIANIFIQSVGTEWINPLVFNLKFLLALPMN